MNEELTTTAYKFWMVWRLNTDNPIYQHLTKNAAENEAIRLAQKHPRNRFYILEAVGGFQCSIPLALPITLVEEPSGE